MFPFAFFRRLISRCSVAGLALALASGVALAGGERTVVELFTSQGCSSCPPADEFLTELADKPNIVALTYNVDYWDYLGWKDTLATAENTKRQKDYAERRGDGAVYTPQMVIDGIEHVVGSRRGEVERLIAESRDESRVTRPSLSIERDGRELAVRIGGQGLAKQVDATVWFLVVEPRVKVQIQKGENLDKTITYTNVVRKMVPVGMWRGQDLEITLPAAEFVQGDKPHGVVLVQEDHGGPILAATAIVSLGDE
jgi:hypothetical protein